MSDPEVEEILKTIREAQEPRELTPAEAKVFKAAMAHTPGEFATRYLRTPPCPTKACPAMRIGTLQHLYIELDAVEGAIENILTVSGFDDLNERRAELLGQIKELEREKS